MVVFSDGGFDDGTFDAWSGTGGGPIIQSVYTHHGPYAMEVNNFNEYARIQVADSDTLHTRCYFRLNTTIAFGETINLISIFSPTWTIIGYVQLIEDAIGYGEQIPGGGGWHPVNWKANNWYCTELKIHRNDVAGEYRLYFEGVEVLNDTGLDSSGIPAGWYILFGDYSLSGVAYTLQIDDCVVDTSYIGLQEFPIPVLTRHYQKINKIMRG